MLHVLINLSTSQFVEVPGPNLARGKKSFHPWTEPGPPYSDYQPIIGTRQGTAGVPKTLQQKLRSKRKLSSGGRKQSRRIERWRRKESRWTSSWPDSVWM